MAQRHVRTAFDGFILGAFIGLGFQIVEDILYAMTSAGTQFGANQIGASVGTIILRMLTGVAAHILYSAIFCAGVIYLFGRPAEPRRIGRGLLLIAIPMLLHGTWDSVAAIAGQNALTLIGLLIGTIVVALIIVARVYKLTVAREREFVRDVMAPEQARNVISPIELDAMAGNRKARKAYRKAGRNRQEHRRARYILKPPMRSPTSWPRRAVPKPTGCALPVPRSPGFARAYRRPGDSALTAAVAHIANRTTMTSAAPRMAKVSNVIAVFTPVLGRCGPSPLTIQPTSHPSSVLPVQAPHEPSSCRASCGWRRATS